MKHIVSFSGGKDSTAMLLMMLEKKMPVDYIIFCDTGKEFPQLYDHIQQVSKYLKKHYNKDIIVLQSNKSYDYYMFEHIKSKGKNKGKSGYGWANMRIRWCTSNLKTNVMNQFLKNLNDDCVEYIGIAYDEPKRIKNKKYPLYDWGITEKDALEYCYSKGFYWGGLYEHFDRLSCWCCPLKNLKELKILYKYYPELWRELKDMDKRSYNKFRSNYSVDELEIKFQNTDYEQVVLL